MSPRSHLSRLWAEHPYFDPQTQAEIAATRDTAELEDRFYKDLEFGTGGLRGVIAAGTNRMSASGVAAPWNGSSVRAFPPAPWARRGCWGITPAGRTRC